MTIKANSKRQAVSTPVQQLNWPLFVSTPDLSLETVLENQIYVVRSLFTSKLSRQYVSFLSGLPLITTPHQPKKGDALRVNDRFEVNDLVFAEQLWNGTGLRDLVSAATHSWGGDLCGLNPRIRIYRYKKGQFFGQHYDESNNIILPTSPSTPAKTTWTLLIYLTGPATGCIGGETCFFPELGTAKQYSDRSSRGMEPLVVDLEVGMALLHKHGNDCMLHEGREVTAGEKWVIRSDLCVKR